MRRAWERDGFTPREVLRKMGAAGMLGLMFAPEYGGGGADALTNLVFAEALSQSTFGGFIVTVLVHTDMASPHLHHAGTAEQLARYMPRITERRAHHRGRRSPSRGAGSDVAGIRTTAARDGDGWVLERHQAVHHQRRARRPATSSPRAPVETRHAASRSSSSRRARPGFTVGRTLEKTGWLSLRHRRAGVRGLPHPGGQPARRASTKASAR